MKSIKNYFIARGLRFDSMQSVIRKYPEKVDKIGIIISGDLQPVANFITKLKIGFGSNCQIFIFAHGVDFGKETCLHDKSEQIISIQFKDFKWFGGLKNVRTVELLKQLDFMIDMALTESILKSYLLHQSNKAYKVSLDKNYTDYCNLIINTNSTNEELYADEIIKYHNILKNG